MRRTLWVLALTLAGCTSAVPPGGGVATTAVPTGTSPADEGLLAPETIVDEYKVAGPIECPLDPSRPHDHVVTDAVIREVNARCDEVVAIAMAAVVKRHSLDRSAIGTSRVYSPYLDPGHEFSAAAYVVVFDLADGSQVAGGVFCAIGPCRFMNPRNLGAPEPVDHSGPEAKSSPSS